jgi:hypothetical protein
MKIYGIEEKMYGFKLEDDGDWDYFGVTMGGTKADYLHHVGLDKLDHEKVNKVIGSSFDERFDKEDESEQGWQILDYLYDKGLCNEDHVVFCKILYKLLYNVFSVQEEAEAFVQENGDRELSVVELEPEGCLARM